MAIRLSGRKFIIKNRRDNYNSANNQNNNGGVKNAKEWVFVSE
jgi:hypothetical protein